MTAKFQHAETDAMELSRTRWLALMRWGAVAIEAAAVSFATFVLELPLPQRWLWLLIAVVVATNLWLSRSRALTTRGLAMVIALDVIVLTTMLSITGGATNPFTAIFLVYIALSAVMLDRARTWAITACCVVGFGLLFAFRDPHSAMGHGGGHGFQTHLYGMFVAFILAATLIGYFVAQLSHAVRDHERKLAEANEREHRWSKLASIGSLAAGAAHEMGTPLSTIAIAAKEMTRQLRGMTSSADKDALVADADLIRQEVGRCREVLDRIALQGGELSGESPTNVDLDEIIEEVRQHLSPQEADRWKVNSKQGSVVGPRRGLTQLIENLTRNAFDACPQGIVSLDTMATDSGVGLHFKDEGKGMDTQTMKRATEPFFTTKNADDRMGLGLFLARALVESMNGQLTIESQVDRGTTIRVNLPNEPRA